jgi:hypothetical protein
MSNRGKLKREKLAEAASERREEIAARKREQREPFRAKYSRSTTLREKLWAIADSAWYILGGPLVWVFHRGPIFRNRSRTGTKSGA